jgi:glycosyltransferase involved in cell wall biosynthesis
MIGLEDIGTRSGGLNRYFNELRQSLRRANVRTQAVVLGCETPLTDADLVIAGSPSSPLPLRLFKIWRATSHTDRVNLIDSHFALTSFLTIHIGKYRNTTLVVHFQGPWAQESQHAGARRIPVAIKRYIERSVYRKSDAVITLTESFKELVVREYGIPSSAVKVITPGVDILKFAPGPLGDARERLSISDETWVAVTVRRLVPRMGIDTLLHSWQKVVAGSSRSCHLLIVGDGPERGSLERLSHELGIEHEVTFTGRVGEEALVSAYRLADVSVVPSVALEGFGLVVLESLATGTPVIATEIGGLPEIVGKLSNDCLVKPADSAALAERLAAALENRQPLPSHEACREFSLRYKWDEVARRHLDFYEQITAPPHGEVRVVILEHIAELSGGELAMVRLIPALRDKGVQVHVIVADDGPLVSRLEGAGATVEVLPLGRHARQLRKDSVQPKKLPLRSLIDTALYEIRLIRRLRRLEPDVVHTNTLKSALYGGLAARIAGIPCVWHIRDRISDDYLPHAAVRLVRLSSKILPTAVIANSESTLQTLPKGGTARRSIGRSVISSPVDPDYFLQSASRGAGPIRVGIVGRIAPWKGQDLFVRSFARAFPDGREQAVIIGAPLFGEDDYQESLKLLVVDLGIEDRVEFTGFKGDVRSELQNLDVLVHASVLPEPFGQVVVEGMASGLPVVAADAGGPAAIITPGVDGILYRMGDADALSEALVRLRDDGDLRDRLGAAARLSAERYRPEVIADLVIAVYKLLVQTPQRSLTRGLGLRA